MRWYRLTEEERRATKAPAEVDGLGMLALTLFGLWRRDAVFVLVTVFVDESGTGGEPRMMLGALVAPAHQWIAFNTHWRRLLDKERIEFSHLTAMENGEPPFEDWNTHRLRNFLIAASTRVQKNCDFGLTVAMDIDAHKTEYREKLHPKAHKDSAYGTMARGLIEAIYGMAKPYYGDDVRLNFVFENSDHFGEANRVFTDSKRHVTEMAPHLGTITPGEKAEFCGLQGSDLLASMGRQTEADTKFKEALGLADQVRVIAEKQRCPLFHLKIDDRNFPDFRRQAELIAREKKWAKRARQFDKRKERGSA
jgi:hypothetical protein